MNEFEWRLGLRSLRTPLEPRRELWTEIDARLDVSPVRDAGSGQSRLARWAIAAGFAGLSLLAVALSQLQGAGVAGSQLAAAHRPWKPADPRLVGAAVELDAAEMELRQALAETPQSPALQRLLSRTRQQETRLRLRERQAG